MGLWSTQAKVEGIGLKAAWHWSRDCSILNDPLREPGRTPLYVGLLSTWGSIINHWLWRWSFSLHRDPDGERGGGGIYWAFEGGKG